MSVCTNTHSAELHVAGEVIVLTGKAQETEKKLAKIVSRFAKAPWPAGKQRRPKNPEDCFVVIDPSANPVFTAASRLTADDDGWVVDPVLIFGPTWHAATVVASADGKLIGFLVIEDDQVRITPLGE